MDDAQKKWDVTMTMAQVAQFFKALDPNMEVTVRDQGYEDPTGGQYHSYALTFCVSKMNDWWDTLLEGPKKAEIITRFMQTTKPWIYKQEPEPLDEEGNPIIPF